MCLKQNFLYTVYNFLRLDEVPNTHHMSICVEYSVDPRRTSGGLYQSVTTSFEYVLVGTDFALANPKSAS